MPHIMKSKSKERYIVDARDIGGGQKVFKTELKAKNKLREWTHDHFEGKFIDSTNAVSFETCIKSWLASNSERVQFGDIGEGELGNMECSAKHIRKINFGGQPIGKVKVSELRAGPLAKMVLPQIRTGRAPATAKKILVHFKAIFKDAVLSEFIAYDPARDLKLPKNDGANDVEDIAASLNGKKSLADRISSNNVKKIIAAAGEKYKRQIEMIAYTGVRVGELRAATWDQINFGDDQNSATFTIDRAIKKGGSLGQPKTYSGNRIIALDDDLVRMLRAWKIAQPLEQRGNNLIFPNREGGIGDGDNWRNRGVVPACKAAGADPVTLRELRHHFASILIFDATFTEATVTQLMGHTDINFTKKQYASWLPNAKRDKQISKKLTAARRAH